jgi:flagellar assembly protein FliH
MAATAKYLFDEDFATGQSPTISVVEADRRRTDAESQAYRKGFAAAQTQVQNEAAQRLAAALTVIGDGMGRIEKALAGIESRLETEAVDVAVAVGAKLAPELIAREPFVEVAALATECFRHLVKVPHVVVRISPDLYEMAKEKLDDIARSGAFEGRLMVMSDDGMAAGDCRIEWADGGVVRDRAATETTINVCVTRYLGAKIDPSDSPDSRRPPR